MVEELNYHIEHVRHLSQTFKKISVVAISIFSYYKFTTVFQQNNVML